MMDIAPYSTHSCQRRCKRALDVLLALLLLLLLLPLLLLLALLIRATSRGPVLFAQERVGLGGRSFRCLKFRTMLVESDRAAVAPATAVSHAGPYTKHPADPRVTPVGRLVRPLSLDELPQLVNVLLGDMSLVGPRPLPVADHERLRLHIPPERQSMPPGITSLWAVEGRSTLTFAHWMQLDVQYIRHWSLWLDLVILLRTVPAVLSRRGAY